MLSVLVALHNEGENIVPFYKRTKPVLEGLPGSPDWQIVFLNDGSQDDSLERIIALRAKDARVKVITLSRNFGYQPALVAGLTLAQSDWYAILDVDCEDPPELLSEFYEAAQRGAQLAYGIRSNREEAAVVTWFRGLFYHINKRIADSPTIMWMAEFSLMSRQVRDAALAARTTFPFLRNELAFVGFAREGIAYRRSKRALGKSHYNFLRMAKFAVGGFLAGSTFPLRFILYLAAAVAVGYPSLVLLLGLSLKNAFYLAFFISFYMLLLTLPVLSLYLARTYRNVVGRPVFIVDEQRTFLA